MSARFQGNESIHIEREIRAYLKNYPDGCRSVGMLAYLEGLFDFDGELIRRKILCMLEDRIIDWMPNGDYRLFPDVPAKEINFPVEAHP